MGHRLTRKILMGHRCRTKDGYNYNLATTSLQFCRLARTHSELVTLYFPSTSSFAASRINTRTGRWNCFSLVARASFWHIHLVTFRIPSMSTGPLSAADLQVSSLLFLALIALISVLIAPITR